MNISKGIIKILNDETVTEADKESIKSKYSKGIPLDKIVEIIKLLRYSLMDKEGDITRTINCDGQRCDSNCPLWGYGDDDSCNLFSSLLGD